MLIRNCTVSTGGMYLTMADMQTFLKFISGGGNEKVLSSAMLREWFLPRMLLPDGVSGFGMPWEMTQAGAQNVVRFFFSLGRTGSCSHGFIRTRARAHDTRKAHCRLKHGAPSVLTLARGVCTSTNRHFPKKARRQAAGSTRR
jgi:hypothetical protein